MVVPNPQDQKGKKRASRTRSLLRHSPGRPCSLEHLVLRLLLPSSPGLGHTCPSTHVTVAFGPELLDRVTCGSWTLQSL